MRPAPACDVATVRWPVYTPCRSAFPRGAYRSRCRTGQSLSGMDRPGIETRPDATPGPSGLGVADLASGYPACVESPRIEGNRDRVYQSGTQGEAVASSTPHRVSPCRRASGDARVLAAVDDRGRPVGLPAGRGRYLSWREARTASALAPGPFTSRDSFLMAGPGRHGPGQVRGRGSTPVTVCRVAGLAEWPEDNRTVAGKL